MVGNCRNNKSFRRWNKIEVEKVKIKGFDLKMTTKKAVGEFKKELTKTGSGRNDATTPPKEQFKILSFVGPVFTGGAPGTENCVMANAAPSAPATTVNNKATRYTGLNNYSTVTRLIVHLLKSTFFSSLTPTL